VTSCDYFWIRSPEDLHECQARARRGDANAAFNIGKLYEKGAYHTSISGRGINIPKDPATAFQWYKTAADLGHETSLRIVFDSYYFGQLTPENRSEAERYLEKGALQGHEWAVLVLARRSESGNPEKAIEMYLQLAKNNNCHAQARLAKIYFDGQIVPQDLKRSYFWALLGSVGGYTRRSEGHILALERGVPSTGNEFSCSLI
jgi:hypothetical protein